MQSTSCSDFLPGDALVYFVLGQAATDTTDICFLPISYLLMVYLSGSVSRTLFLWLEIIFLSFVAQFVFTWIKLDMISLFFPFRKLNACV